MNAPVPSRDTLRTASAEAAITALFDAHFDFVCRTLRHLGVAPGQLDDAVQDVFVTAYRRWAGFEGRASPRTWLFGIARRIAYRHRRALANRRESPIDAAERTASTRHDPYARHDAARSLSVLLGALDRHKRAVFVLAELEGMTAPEIADALQIPVGTVYSRQRAAWQRLGVAAEAEREALRRRLQARATAGDDDAPARRRRTWAVVAGSFGGARSVPVLATAVSKVGVGWGIVGTLALIGVCVGAIGWGGRSRVGGEAERAGAARAPLPPAAQAHAEAPPGHGARPDTEATASPDRSGITATDQPAPRVELTPPRTAHSPRPGPSAPSPDAPDSELGQEVLLIRRAQAAVREGDGDEALRLLAEHERRFATGQLRTERETTWIRALCASGRRGEAQARLRARGLETQPACDEPSERTTAHGPPAE